jgi:integrase
MARKGLTTIRIENEKAGAVRREIPDDGCTGLYLIVQPSGKKSFALRYRRPIDRRPAKLTLGNGSMGLAAARAAAKAALYEVSQGRDPGMAKAEERHRAQAAAANTLRAVVEEYLDREGKKLRTVGQRRRAFERLVFPALGNRPIADIQRVDVVRLLDRVEDNSGPRMADMVLVILGRVFNWHAARSDTFRSPIVRGMGRVNARERARSRVLSDDELRCVWNAANALAPPRGALIKFLLLTAARRSEVVGLRWPEIVGGEWVLPASRNKTKQELVRPLSATALAALASIPRIDGCEYVFSTDGQRPLSGLSWVKTDLDKASGVRGWRLHDLRRTARTLMSRAGIGADIAERCLGHVIGGVRGIYDRHEFCSEKKHAFEALAAVIERIVNPQANVVPLKDRA